MPTNRGNPLHSRIHFELSLHPAFPVIRDGVTPKKWSEISASGHTRGTLTMPVTRAEKSEDPI